MNEIEATLVDMRARALEYRRAGRDCCAQQLEQSWVGLSRAIGREPGDVFEGDGARERRVAFDRFRVIPV
jgi:hypothetical protein